MRDASVSIRPFEAQRVEVASPRSFDEVVAIFRSLVGTASLVEAPSPGAGKPVEDLGEQYGTAMQRLGGFMQANFETVVRGQLGPSQFMLFHQIDHSTWLPVYGVTRRVLRLIFGNPIIAITMMRSDLTAGLFAPVECVITEDEDGRGCIVVYLLPSSVVAAANPAVLPAARELDRILAALISSVTGVSVPTDPQ